VLGERDEDGELLTWSAASKGREGWMRRLESGRSALLLSDRDAIFERARILRHHRALIAAADDGLLLWEAARRACEGLTAGMVRTEAAAETLLRYASTLDEVERPRLAASPDLLPSPDDAQRLFDTATFDAILAREPWRRGFGGAAPSQAFLDYATKAAALLASGGVVVLLQSPPRLGERISSVLERECGAASDLLISLREAEEDFFSGRLAKGASLGEAAWAWDASTLETAFTVAGFQTRLETVNEEEERLISDREIVAWFDPEKSSWGKAAFAAIGGAAFENARRLLAARAERGPIPWHWKALLIEARLPVAP
jgi:putative ATPase